MATDDYTSTTKLTLFHPNRLARSLLSCFVKNAPRTFFARRSQSKGNLSPVPPSSAKKAPRKNSGVGVCASGGDGDGGDNVCLLDESKK